MEYHLTWEFSKLSLAAEQHMDCRGSQRGSRETSSLCKTVVTWMRVVAVVVVVGMEKSWTDWGHAPFCSRCCMWRTIQK